jgi:hypothetical protein
MRHPRPRKTQPIAVGSYRWGDNPALDTVLRPLCVSKHAKAKRHNGKREPVGTPKPKNGEGEK